MEVRLGLWRGQEDLKEPHRDGDRVQLGFSPGGLEKGLRVPEGRGGPEPAAPSPAAPPAGRRQHCGGGRHLEGGRGHPAIDLGGATAGREAAASPRLDLPFGGSETCSALTGTGGVPAGLSPKGFCRSRRVRTWTGWTARLPPSSEGRLEAWASGLDTSTLPSPSVTRQRWGRSRAFLPGALGWDASCSALGPGGSRTRPPPRARVACPPLNLSRPLPPVAELHRPCLFWGPGGGED